MKLNPCRYVDNFTELIEIDTADSKRNGKKTKILK